MWSQMRKEMLLILLEKAKKNHKAQGGVDGCPFCQLACLRLENWRKDGGTDRELDKLYRLQLEESIKKAVHPMCRFCIFEGAAICQQEGANLLSKLKREGSDAKSDSTI